MCVCMCSRAGDAVRFVSARLSGRPRGSCSTRSECLGCGTDI